ncbi:MAG: ATPase, T2SS/T4P/T4SS family [Candidatus Roizmanbacteria bacterium]
MVNTELDDQLYQYLKELEVISIEDLDRLQNQTKEKKISFSELLLHEQLITDDNLAKVMSDILHIQYAHINDHVIPIDLLRAIPFHFAKRHSVIVFKKDELGYHIATSDPSDILTLEFLKKYLGESLQTYYATPSEISSSLKNYETDIVNTFNSLLQQAESQSQSEPPIIKMVDVLLDYAVKNKASDIHIEAGEKGALVRMRIDGILHDILTISKDIYSRIVTRIKVMSKLRTDEHLAAQDGKLHFSADDKKADFRVSVVPAIYGEKIVLRILSEALNKFQLNQLGILPPDLENIRKSYDKPYGMILSTGPTGSGKTTTMYAVIQLLNTREVNISTIEDPVEYDIPGITQIQVNAKTNLTFANGLRSILRQDPNIILVGEIRDKETADIGVNAAMTGHLVLSTLHTNDAATAIPRLIDMGIEPFLLASTLTAIIAQRLVRTIHIGCKISVKYERKQIVDLFGEELTTKYFGNDEIIRAYKGKGCHVDHETGFQGRLGLYEVLTVDEDIRQLIVKAQNSDDIRSIARKKGMTTMLEDGIQKVKQGLTTFDEIARIIKE